MSTTKNICLFVFSIIVGHACILWVNSLNSDYHPTFNSELFSIASGSLLGYVILRVITQLTSRQADIIIVVRPNAVAQEHHEIIEKLGSLDAERNALLARKEALETPGSESSKYIALSNERKS